ncbi:hypothetical protein JANAI62_28510 [Jannaschia pagri]|uniref:Uncharacterized protein n=1 Tax=Jannaschia pagri TaxID=2829797 RepID=A0ABQ4NPC5_9RHOB|nr:MULTISPECIES: hypothetical protein [unclassified Jannaschia]GIT92393.1 hypothetical protein JANAI61_28510 [Jannaschia sp. AI_61]GIT96228.1 hypothetical protein JANAI62_28510 [Jannaschia sp. AI_62]
MPWGLNTAQTAEIEAGLLRAHAHGDTRTLVSLYTEAATEAPPDAAAFLLTQAWVYALSAGDPRAKTLSETLAAMGRA